LPEQFDSEGYDIGIVEFQKNEGKAMELFIILDTSDAQQAMQFIMDSGIPNWQNNIQIINELDEIAGLPPELFEMNQLLREYCQLRIESYQLIGRSLLDNTMGYKYQIMEINMKIDEILKKLNESKNEEIIEE